MGLVHRAVFEHFFFQFDLTTKPVFGGRGHWRSPSQGLRKPSLSRKKKTVCTSAGFPVCAKTSTTSDLNSRGPTVYLVEGAALLVTQKFPELG